MTLLRKRSSISHTWEFLFWKSHHKMPTWLGTSFLASPQHVFWDNILVLTCITLLQMPWPKRCTAHARRILFAPRVSFHLYHKTDLQAICVVQRDWLHTQQTCEQPSIVSRWRSSVLTFPTLKQMYPSGCPNLRLAEPWTRCIFRFARINYITKERLYIFILIAKCTIF